MARAWVFGDDLDTDQMVPGRYAPFMVGAEKFHTYAFCDARPGFAKEVRQGDLLVGGGNFGCGSSREYAPLALKKLGVGGIVAVSFARIFFRNCVATGELYPFDANERLCDTIQTGDLGTLDFDHDTLTVNGTTYSLKPLGEVRPVIDAGGLFNYARESGMIAARG